jgi:chemotaxis protein MotB
MAGALSRRRAGANDYTWPGYVDALTTLLMVLIFLLSVFSVAQFTLSTALSNRDTAIDALNRQVGDLASQLSLEKRSAEDLQKDVARLSILTTQLRADRENLKTERDGLKTEREQLNVRIKDLDKAMDLQRRPNGRGSS